MASINKVEEKREATVLMQPFADRASEYAVKGTVWFSFEDGKIVVHGCITSTGQKVSLGQTYRDSKAEFMCLLEDNAVVLMPSACVFKGERRAIGSIFCYKTFYYQCVQFTDHSIAVVAFGCADGNEQLVLLGDEFRKDDFAFLCQIRKGKIVAVGVKCYIPSMNVTVIIGERFPHRGYTYECKRKDKYSVGTEVVGCADRKGKLVDAGQRYVKGRDVFECQHDDRGSFKRTVVGCYAKDHKSDEYSEYNFGDTFYQAYSQGFGLLMQCAWREGRAQHKPVECIRHSDDVDHHIGVGCAAFIGEKAFLCKADSETSVMIKFISYSKDKKLFLKQNDVKECRSKFKLKN